ncbi:MAG TPA: four helix bundle protein [Terriglobia bacterium]|nr:four helix bundle protein [Terriglobia bacterium]
MMVRGYRDLKVWQKAVDLVAASYRLCKSLPQSETFGLSSQIRRAAVSIPANIAEGHGRDHLGDYLRHLSVANGSLMELETHFIVAERLRFLSGSELDAVLEMTSEIGKMLAGLSQSLKASAAKSGR